MLILKLVFLILGLAFIFFGFFIFFLKKYNLINGFDKEFKLKRKTENYAKKVGLIEFITGIILLILSVFLMMFL